MEHKRWIVTLKYKTENGVVDIQHHIEELIDIDEIIERGPHFDTLISGTFAINPKRRMIVGLTVEAALEL